MFKFVDVKFDNKDMFPTCPTCGSCESHPVDEQRQHLQTFKILDELPDDPEGYELSKMECCKGHTFIARWYHPSAKVPDDY